jgi:heat shock 70kDa protein 1/2/6/8
VASKFSAEDKKKILDKANEELSWLDNNQSAEQEEFEEHLKEAQKVIAPIISKIYQSSGGAAPDGMGGFPGAAGGMPIGGTGGPVIDEVD